MNGSAGTREGCRPVDWLIILSSKTSSLYTLLASKRKRQMELGAEELTNEAPRCGNDTAHRNFNTYDIQSDFAITGRGAISMAPTSQSHLAITDVRCITDRTSSSRSEVLWFRRP